MFCQTVDWIIKTIEEPNFDSLYNSGSIQKAPHAGNEAYGYLNVYECLADEIQ